MQQVAIINAGKVLACDSPGNLKNRLQREAIFHLEVSALNGALPSLQTLPGIKKIVHVPGDGRSALELILEADDALAGVVATLTTHDIRILNLQKREPTLEDVFVDVVGMSLSEAEKTQ